MGNGPRQSHLHDISKATTIHLVDDLCATALKNVRFCPIYATARKIDRRIHEECGTVTKENPFS